MTDIVERLRRNPRGVAFEFEHECADEIERLRAENSHLHHQTNKLGGDVLRLRAEVAALQDQRRERHADISDLAVLVRRLAIALRKAQPEHSTASDAAMEFLRKRGLDGEVLR